MEARQVEFLRDPSMENQLVRLCIEAACESRECVDKWRRQRRTLERLPSHLADALLHRLLTRRLLYPSLLECFKYSAEKMDASGQNSVDAEWMAYLGAFHSLLYLNIADCHRITNSALWALSGMTSLKELNISRCFKVNDAGIRHLLSISNLEMLYVAETGVTANGVILLSNLKKLRVLDLGGLPVTDVSLTSLKVLKNLHYLDLWGSKISNSGALVLKTFPNLTFLNIAWTSVTMLPNFSSLKCLNMSNCSTDSIFEESGNMAPLSKLVLSGATLLNEAEALAHIDTSSLSFLDVSHSSLSSLHRLFPSNSMKLVEHLNLSSCMVGDDSIELVTCMGGHLRSLNLSSTKVSSAGVCMLAGNVPNLEFLLLSQTAIDEASIFYISMMPSLKVVDLSNTNIKGFIHQAGSQMNSNHSLTALQNLKHLQRLNLEQTQVSDEALYPLSSFQELSHLSLKSASLTDASLLCLSSIQKLENVSICDAVLTNCGLELFKPSATLKMMDLRGCWLLTEDAILSFCKNHPQVEVRHENGHVIPTRDHGLKRPSPSRGTSKLMPSTTVKFMPSMPPYFLDQRLKYSRDELLALQHAGLPSACIRDVIGSDDIPDWNPAKLNGTPILAPRDDVTVITSFHFVFLFGYHMIRVVFSSQNPCNFFLYRIQACLNHGWAVTAVSRLVLSNCISF